MCCCLCGAVSKTGHRPLLPFRKESEEGGTDKTRTELMHEVREEMWCVPIGIRILGVREEFGFCCSGTGLGQNPRLHSHSGTRHFHCLPFVHNSGLANPLRFWCNCASTPPTPMACKASHIPSLATHAVVSFLGQNLANSEDFEVTPPQFLETPKK